MSNIQSVMKAFAVCAIAGAIPDRTGIPTSRPICSGAMIGYFTSLWTQILVKIIWRNDRLIILN